MMNGRGLIPGGGGLDDGPEMAVGCSPFAPPTVVNLRNEPYDLYIGRAVKSRGLPLSRWANPVRFSAETDRAHVLDLYEDHVRSSGLLDWIHELSGLRLGCWCKPKSCHGDVLVRLWHERMEGSST